MYIVSALSLYGKKKETELIELIKEKPKVRF